MSSPSCDSAPVALPIEGCSGACKVYPNRPRTGLGTLGGHRMSIWSHASRGRTRCDSTSHPQTLGPAAKSFATFLLMHLGDSGMSRHLGDVSVTRGTAVDVPVVGRALLCRQRTAGARTAIGGHCDGANAGPRHHPHRRRPGALTCTCTHIVAAAWACILPIGFRERASYRPMRVDERPSFQGRWASLLAARIADCR